MECIREKVEPKWLKKSEYLYKAGEKRQALFIVRQGMIRIFRLTHTGKEQLVRVLKAGDFVGERALFHPGEVYQEYAQSVTDAKICLIKKEDFQPILAENPTISFKMMEELSKRLEESDKHTTQLVNEQVSSRLALFIYEQAKSKQNRTLTIKLPFTRREIASYLGTTPETLSRKFKQLEKAGLIEQCSCKKVKIHDAQALLHYEG